jgi:hypothetical protein
MRTHIRSCLQRGLRTGLRTKLIVLVVLAALAVPAAAAAAGGSSPGVICGTACDGGGGGWSGCTQLQTSHSASVWPFASIKHYLVVSYCKRNGTITSLSIAAHGCDTGGVANCSVGPAWQNGGGVGSGYATFEAHANWFLYTSPYYNSTDVLYLTVPLG